MDNISQIISRSIGGYSIGSILSALLTFLICLIVVRLVKPTGILGRPQTEKV